MVSKSTSAPVWGTRITDFRVGRKTRVSKPTRNASKINERTKTPDIHRQRRNTLASSLDEFQKFANHVTQLCDSGDAMTQAAFTDTDDDEDDPGAKTDAEEVEQAAARGALTLTAEDIQAFVDLLDPIGPTPSIESRKHLQTPTNRTIHESSLLKFANSVPKALQLRILRSDRWYTEILHKLFEEAAKFTQKDHSKGPFTGPLWGWMYANRHEDSQTAFLRILLHPHIRSYRVRAALGGQSYESLFDDLQLRSLDTRAPNVMGTYFLAGRRRSDSEFLKADIAYVGQACALNTKISSGRGIRSRIIQHAEKIEQEKSETTRKKRAAKIILAQDQQGPENQPGTKKSVRLWASQRLAHNDIENVSYQLLSLFPVPRKHLRSLDQMRFLLTLAEAIDIVFLGTLSPQYSVRFGGECGVRIRPADMPKPPYEGLNRALPTSQVVKFYSLERTNWKPSEVDIFMQVFKDYPSEVYGAGAIRWDVVEKLLQEHGVTKPKAYSKSLYHELAANPDSGLSSFKSMKYRYLWSRIFDLKTFLDQRQLVIPPRDDKDECYHIAELEGTATFFQLEDLLRRHGYENSDQPDIQDHRNWFQWIGARLLPHLLSREVWERIQGKHIGNIFCLMHFAKQ